MKVTAFIIAAVMSCLTWSCVYEIDKPLPECELSVAAVNLTEKNDSYDEAVAEITAVGADVVMLSGFGEGWETIGARFEEKGYAVSFHTEVFEREVFRLAFLVKKEIEVGETVACGEAYINGYPGQNAKLGILRLNVNGHSVTLLTMNPVRYDKFVSGLLDKISDGRFVYENAEPAVKIDGEPVIWGGDFGFLPTSRLYKEFGQSGLTDAHTADDHRYNMTENNSVRTDYLFCSKTIHPSFSGTFRVSGSNHRGVVAGFSFQ